MSASTRTSEIISGCGHGDLVVNDDLHTSAGVTDEEPELSSNAPNSKRPRPRLFLSHSLTLLIPAPAWQVDLQVVSVSLILEPEADVSKEIVYSVSEEKQ